MGQVAGVVQSMEHLNRIKKAWTSLEAQWVEDPALSLLWLWLLLCQGFNPWPGNFCIPWLWVKTKRGG